MVARWDRCGYGDGMVWVEACEEDDWIGLEIAEIHTSQ